MYFVRRLFFARLQEDYLCTHDTTSKLKFVLGLFFLVRLEE